MKFAYSNNGQSMRAVDDGMETEEEVVFDHPATDAELLAAFPAYVTLAELKAKAALIVKAKAILSDHDATWARMSRAGQPWPPDYAAYDTALRAVASGASTTWPDKPTKKPWEY